MKDFKVSVIIPVYNAEKFVEKAVSSAHEIPQVGEVILVEDGSPDNALEICKQLESKFSKVVLYRHPNGENRGAGPSRNLGIKRATYDFIAFLDADDWYLPNRFEKDQVAFRDKTVDGVYNASSYEINSDYAYQIVKNRFKTDPRRYIHSVREVIQPEDLFYYLLNGGKGHFNTPSITVRKNVFKEVGYFCDLKLHQDNHMFLRIAINHKLVGGELQIPTSKIRVHQNNRIKNVSRKSRIEYYNRLYNDVFRHLKTKRDKTTVIKKLIAAKTYHIKNRYLRLIFISYRVIEHFIFNPKDLKEINLKYLT